MPGSKSPGRRVAEFIVGCFAAYLVGGLLLWLDVAPYGGRSYQVGDCLRGRGSQVECSDPKASAEVVRKVDLPSDCDGRSVTERSEEFYPWLPDETFCIESLASIPPVEEESPDISAGESPSHVRQAVSDASIDLLTWCIRLSKEAFKHGEPLDPTLIEKRNVALANLQALASDYPDLKVEGGKSTEEFLGVMIKRLRRGCDDDAAATLQEVVDGELR